MLALGFDIGGSWVRAALATEQGKILRKSVERIATGSIEALLGQIESMAKEVGGPDYHSVGGVGLGMAGRLQMRDGILVDSPHTPFKGIHIRRELEERLDKEVVLINDGIAATLAERVIGAGARERNMVYVAIGTGIGGGAVVDGNLLLGKEGNAHEMGHMIIDMEGRIGCSCGGRGHWEAYTSGSGMPEYARLLAEGYSPKTPLCDLVAEGRGGAKQIFDAAMRGDGFAKQVLEEASRVNAMAFANLVDLYDPRLIVVGGGVALKNVDLVIRPIAKLLPEFAFNAPPAVVATPLGEDAQLLGAVLAVPYSRLCNFR